MPAPSSSPSPEHTAPNPLKLPLLIVGAVAVLEALAIAFLLAALLSRHPVPAPIATPNNGPTTSPRPATDIAAGSSNPAPKNPVRGKKGQKVDSAGFALTIENIVYEPTFKELGNIPNDRRYLALLVAVENNTGHNDSLYPSQFSLKDDQGYHYDPLTLRLINNTLEWRTLGNRETLRGYVDFTVPKTAKNLTLVYPREPAPIHIELGE